ncbi:MAG TPA: cytochrome c biogenesis protein CcsA, partial [Pyrinomonadaceae bacterium]|nr:cytochrome c biogenesis protein CcsA [Pyrinomonadaceae bacterium]
LAYAVAAIHALLAFANKRRSAESTALWSLGTGFLLHTAALVLDWVRDGHYPLFGQRETFSFLAWTLVIAYGLALYRYRARALGALTLPLVTLLILIAALVPENDGGVANSVIAGAAGWLFPVHTTLLVCAYAAFFVAFAASVMYLWQERELKLKTFSAFFHRLPSLSTVDDIGATAAGVGFTLLSLGILTGMIWSSARSGRIWHNDPKEVFALLTWVLYLTMIHYRAQWRGRKAAWAGVAGFVLVIFTFLGTRWLGGYHVFG